jgi:hypothetical protein
MGARYADRRPIHHHLAMGTIISLRDVELKSGSQ